MACSGNLYRGFSDGETPSSESLLLTTAVTAPRFAAARAFAFSIFLGFFFSCALSANRSGAFRRRPFCALPWDLRGARARPISICSETWPVRPCQPTCHSRQNRNTAVFTFKKLGAAPRSFTDVLGLVVDAAGPHPARRSSRTVAPLPAQLPQLRPALRPRAPPRRRVAGLVRRRRLQSLLPSCTLLCWRSLRVLVDVAKRSN